MKAKLVVIGGETKVTEVVLRLPTLIGRGREAMVILPHSLVSRKHCEIYEDDGSLVVRDLDSLNGTFINSERIEGPTVLSSGELLTIGTVTFRAVYEQGGEQPSSFVLPTDSLPPSSGDETTIASQQFSAPVDNQADDPTENLAQGEALDGEDDALSATMDGVE